MQETRVRSLGREDPLEKEIATHSNILVWRIPRTEKPGRLQSMGSQRVGHDWVTSLHCIELWLIFVYWFYILHPCWTCLLLPIVFSAFHRLKWLKYMKSELSLLKWDKCKQKLSWDMVLFTYCTGKDLRCSHHCMNVVPTNIHILYSAISLLGVYLL